MAIVEGRVTAVIHRSESFYILVFESVEPPLRNVKVTGHLHGVVNVRPGVPLRLSGEWVEHPKYGRQLAFTGWSPWAQSPDDVEKFLHECIEGFADRDLAEVVVNAFGLNTYDVFTDQPGRVRDLAAPETPQRAALERAVQGWAACMSVSGLASLFRDFSLGQDLIQAAIREFGSNAVDIIAKNPYRLLVIEGFTFAHADRLALRLDVPTDDVRRLEGAVLWILRFEARDGHLFVRKGALEVCFGLTMPEKLLTTFGDSTTLPARLVEAADSLCATKALIGEGDRLYLPSLYHYERASAGTKPIPVPTNSA